MANASQIREHMEVIASDGQSMGLVDHMEGEDRIKLTRGSSSHGHHHFIPLDWVERVDEHVHLGRSSDFVAANWEHGH